MKVIRRSEFRSMPWKNGGGTTFEIMVEPEGASLDAFDWRVSIAHVEAPGPFSRFPDMDRSIAVLTGIGMTLLSPESAPISLDADTPPWSFPGETPIDCKLTGGATYDFNVMSRRHRIRHRLARIRISNSSKLSRSAPITGICLASGLGLDLATVDGSRVEISLHDFVLLDRHDGDRFFVNSNGEASILVVELTPQSAMAARSSERRIGP